MRPILLLVAVKWGAITELLQRTIGIALLISNQKLLRFHLGSGMSENRRSCIETYEVPHFIPKRVLWHVTYGIEKPNSSR
jgi:hypothetical protein